MVFKMGLSTDQTLPSNHLSAGIDQSLLSLASLPCYNCGHVKGDQHYLLFNQISSMTLIRFHQSVWFLKKDNPFWLFSWLLWNFISTRRDVFLVTDNRVFNGPLGCSPCLVARTAHFTHSVRSVILCYACYACIDCFIHGLTHFAHSLVGLLSLCLHAVNAFWRKNCVCCRQLKHALIIISIFPPLSLYMSCHAYVMLPIGHHVMSCLCHVAYWTSCHVMPVSCCL